MATVSERRWASVLFADLVGFTTLAESRDPEQVRELLSSYFERCRQIVASYDGVVEKFIGDAVMAVWGVPTAHEDDAERAVRTGLDLAAMVAALGEELGAPLALRVGVVTGEVAATIGATSQGMVAGDPVNTASRVQSAARPGEVWVDDATRNATLAAIDYDDAGDHELKGKAQPVRLFAVHGVRGDPVGEPTSSGFVGREHELTLLVDLFESAAAERLPRLVVVEGDAGIGKSRLVAEFQRRVEESPVTTWWHRGRCLAFGQGTTFRALSDAVRTRAGVTDVDDSQVIAERLDHLLEILSDDPTERSWLRAPLLLLVAAGAEITVDRGELYAAWCRFFELVGRGDPVVWVVDDAHLADDGLLDLVDQLVSTVRAGVVVIAMARPDLLPRRPGWGGHRAATIPLGPLPEADMQRLVDELLDGADADVRRAVAEGTGGLPLYAVETARAARDQAPHGGNPETLPVPHSLRSLVRSRLDRLPEASRRVVGDAAVLGLSFPTDQLAALVPDSVDLASALTALQAREVLTLEGDRFAVDRGHLRFSHAVVRQVAYETLSRRDRKSRHLRAAAYLSQLNDEVQDVHAPIAEHLTEALAAGFTEDADRDELRARARHHLALAAGRALTLGAPDEARLLLDRALELEPDGVERADLLLASAGAAEASGDFQASLDRATAAATIFDDSGDRRRGAEAVARSATAMTLLGDALGAEALALPRWEELDGDEESTVALLKLGAVLSPCHIRLNGWGSNPYAERLLQLAERAGDLDELSTAHWRLGSLYSYRGDRVRSLEHFQESLRIARSMGQALALARAYEGVSQTYDGVDLHAGLQAAQDCVEAATRAGDSNYVDYALLNHVIALWRLGDLPGVAEALHRARTTVRDVTVSMALHSWEIRLADALGEPVPDVETVLVTDNQAEHLAYDDISIQRSLADGDPAAAAATAERSLPLLLSYSGLTDLFLDLWPGLMRAALAAGDVPLARRLLEPVEEASDTERLPLLEAHRHRFRGLTAAAAGEPADVVVAELRLGIDQLAALGARGTGAQAHEELGRYLLSVGREQEASVQLSIARSEYVALGADGWLARLDAWASGSDAADA